MNLKSKLGYSKNSPFKNLPEILIEGNTITMANTDIDLYGIPIYKNKQKGKPVLMKAFDKNLITFKNAESVLETPVSKFKFKKGGGFNKFTTGGIPGLTREQIQKDLSKSQQEQPAHLKKIDLELYESSPNYRKLNQYEKELQDGINEGLIQVKTNPDGSFSYVATGQTDPTESPIDFFNTGTTTTAKIANKAFNIAAPYVSKGASVVGKAALSTAKTIGGQLNNAISALSNLAVNITHIGDDIVITAAKPVADLIAKRFGVVANEVKGSYQFINDFTDSSGKSFKKGEIVDELSGQLRIPANKFLENFQEIRNLIKQAGDESVLVTTKKPTFPKQSTTVKSGTVREGAEKHGGATEVVTKGGKKEVISVINPKEITEKPATSFRNLLKDSDKSYGALLMASQKNGGKFMFKKVVN